MTQHLMSAAHQTRNEIIEALLGDDDEIDFDDAKEVTQPPNELFDRQLKELLPAVIQAKEAYLGKRFIRHVDHTNHKGERYIFGRFGQRNHVMSTLLYMDPEKGWVPADPGFTYATNMRHTIKEDDEDEFADEDFKEVFNTQEPRRKYLPLGSYSSGTMREEDLIPAFIQALGMVDAAAATQKKKEWHEIAEDDDDSLAYFCWDELLPALEEHTPPYTYFGAHEGDGADYGVWVSHDSIEDDLRYEELRPMRKGETFVPGDTDVVLMDDSGDYLALLKGETGETIWEI